jgi:hypothetical protein
MQHLNFKSHTVQYIYLTFIISTRYCFVKMDHYSGDPRNQNSWSERNVTSCVAGLESLQWPGEEMATKYKIMVPEALSGKDGALIVNGTDFKKRGAETPGVGWQYLGSVGKVDNGLAFVVVAYSTDRGVTAVGFEQFFQKEWDTKEYAKKRKNRPPGRDWAHAEELDGFVHDKARP